MSEAQPESAPTAAVHPFFTVEAVPVLCNVQWPTRAAALAAPMGSIQLAFDPVSGHLFNQAFDPAIVAYDTAYENSLHFSPRFQRYIHDLCADLIDRYGLRNKTVIDIGCGKGDFLKLIAGMGGNRGVGFDRSYTPDGDPPPGVLFIADFFNADYAAAYPADLIVCRHVLEHIADPLHFLTELRAWIGAARPALFFEVPNALYTLRDRGIWDIIYEHPNYFTPPSLTHCFVQAGFDVQRVAERYNSQFLILEALPAAHHSGDAPPLCIEPAQIESLVHDFAHIYHGTVAEWRGRLAQLRADGARVVIWGAGSKGVTFLNVMQTAEIIAYAVDINPRKHGLYIAGTGQRIVAPDFLCHYQPDIVLVMNPAYADEIRATVAELAIQPTLMLV